MFRTVLVSASDHPSLGLGEAWPGLLGLREEAILARLSYLPRRRKWLLGRAAAKRLVRAMVTDTGLRDDQIEILNQPSGMPFVTLEGRGNWPFSISISHRQEAGFAAAPLDSCGRIGADLETIEPRAPALVRQFFTEAEAASLEAAGGERDVSVARLWSAKEAVLKVLGLGLRVDTRAIEVNTPRNEIFECPEGWLPLEVKLSGDLVIESLPQPLRVVWRREGPYVLTLAVAG